jgi:mono/diheme cytochrome c family protein
VSTGQVFDLRRLTAGDRARFENSVRNGKNQMPPWKGVVSDTEIDEVWHYIRANAYQK